MRVFFVGMFAVLGASALGACSSSSDSKSSQNLDSGTIDLGGDAGDIEVEAGTGPRPVDGGYPFDGGVLAPDRFATGVVAFTPGTCGGFGSDALPDVVLGPPVGGGAESGSLDVVSLGGGGSITLSFADPIVDGPGPDFIVFENAFTTNVNDPSTVYAEPGEVSVSEDGTTWTTFPCTATAYPYGACAGWHWVTSSPENGVSPVDPAAAGGDSFDLHDLGVARATFVRIVDKTGEDCPASPPRPNKNGFDLDAISVVNGATP